MSEGEVDRLMRRLGHERRARREAEHLLARRSHDLGEANRGLATALAQLELTVDERTRALIDLRAVAYIDGLTGLVNRRLFNQRLAEASQPGGESFSLLYIDVDDFKRVNDIYGHACGDTVLRHVGSRLLDSVREIDIVARLAGDEFAILIPGVVARDSLARLAGRVVATMSSPIDLPAVGRRVTVGLSIGVAVYPDDGTDADAISAAADLALYRSKQDGKNRATFCDDQIRNERRLSLELERDLTQALSAGEFLLHYHPLVGMHGDSPRILALEALLRWRHPRRGLIEAREFVPFADQRGLLPNLGQFVLTRTLEDARSWFAGPHAPEWVSVNISDRQLRDEGLSELLTGLLTTSGLPPGHLAIDISESALINSSVHSQALGQKLRALGLRLCIDDFGSAQAGLRMMCEFGATVIKIARELTCRVPGDAAAEAIIETSALLSRRLGILIVAEGVETTAQRDYLRSTGIEHFQGFLFGRPLAAADIPARLARQ
ncbi:MAG TPA: hypothetical protein DCY89_07800 [Gammaproteobacteria bacterium]|nr:hypothetical protein [Gammaproteobacteria bacterium]